MPDTDAFALWSYMALQRPHIIRRPLRIQEASCTLGHVKILTKFLVSNHRHALVFEDDSGVPPGLVDWVTAFLDEVGEGYHVAKIGSLGPEKVEGALRTRIGNHAVMATKKPKAGTHTILYTREGAERVLAAARRDALPYDYFLRWNAGWRFSVLEADPTVVAAGKHSDFSYIDTDAVAETGRVGSMRDGLVLRLRGKLARARASLGKAIGR